ncbi:related to Protein transport protein SEC9 [Hanseniaspora guilliermondii]|uniref:Related to Protein transport protein SEC9 n=1 Tax=Hanseniaspora guilliermondii TaxID=56406 RepID=A0A1L0AYH2_9ASCO|nr:related to Protein transport protein SEC9 [Hanseniaspora guilliermondii]
MGFASKLRHKVGIRPPKEMTYEENQELLDDMGIMRKKNEDKRRKEKFAAYGAMAKDLSVKRNQEHAPEGYEQYTADGETPYVYRREQSAPEDYKDEKGKNKKSYVPEEGYNPYKTNVIKKDKYSQAQENGPSSNPYSSMQDPDYNPYKSFETQKDSETPAAKSLSPFNFDYTQENDNPYASGRSYEPKAKSKVNPYADARSSRNEPKISEPYTSSRINMNQNKKDDNKFDFEDTQLDRYSTQVTDFNSAPINEIGNYIPEEDDFNASIHESAQEYVQQQPEYLNEEYDDFNSAPENQGSRYVSFEEMQRQQQEQQLREEDEEVDTIKKQIRFTKQSSAASTRNTLKMARDAEVAGLNTLGMLGSQSEKLGNVETNLTLMKIHNREADDKVSELKKLNRSIFAVHVSNPFTSKRRARDYEQRVKTQRELDKQMQMDDRKRLEDSTNAIGHTLSSTYKEHNKDLNGENVGLKESYSKAEILNKNKKYMFEGDSEDEDLEVEIDRNLNEIGKISGRLKKIALSQSEEVEKQQSRLNQIENDTDDLDIKLYWNTKRMANIK